jgi:hypothetical protein
MNAINQLFDLLDRWRHLPKYQLERRADIFFALYLREFLQERFKIQLAPELVPEFPIHLAAIYGEDTGEKSCNVDFLAIAADHSVAFFVELKTEGLSRHDEQDNYLLAAQRVGLPALLSGVFRIAAASRKKPKYLHLLFLLERLGLVSLPPAIRQRHATGDLRGLTRDLAMAAVQVVMCPIQVIYFQPAASNENEIGFAEFGKWLERFDDPLSQRFRQSLRSWSSSNAGDA